MKFNKALLWSCAFSIDWFAALVMKENLKVNSGLTTFYAMLDQLKKAGKILKKFDVKIDRIFAEQTIKNLNRSFLESINMCTRL